MNIELDTFEALHAHKALLETANALQSALKEADSGMPAFVEENDERNSIILRLYVLRNLSNRLGQQLSREGVAL